MSVRGAKPRPAERTFAAQAATSGTSEAFAKSPFTSRARQVGSFGPGKLPIDLWDFKRSLGGLKQMAGA
jgi:hypothetical protein